MNFRIEDEIKVVTTKVQHAYGPCLRCGRETEYGKRIPRLGLEWLRKQFEPQLRSRNEKALRIGVAPKARSLAVLEDLICEVCRAGLLNERWAATAERDAELQRRAQLSSRYRAVVDGQ